MVFFFALGAVYYTLKPFKIKNLSVLQKGFYLGIDLLPRSKLIKLLQNRLVKPLAETIGLRRPRLGLLLNIIDGKVWLVIVSLDLATAFCPAITQDPKHGKLVLLKER